MYLKGDSGDAFKGHWTGSSVNTLRPRQDGRHFPDDIFKCVFLNENARISLKKSLKFVRKVRINNILALVQIMAWRRSGDKPLSEPMMVNLLMHICVTRPQWVNKNIAHDDLIKWKHFPPYRPFLWGIHWSPLNSPHKGQWCVALIFSLIYTWINGWVNNDEAADLRCHRTHYDITVMKTYNKYNCFMN